MQYKKDKIDFTNSIKPHIYNFENENIIIGGDFLYGPRFRLKKKFSKDTNPSYRQEIVALLESFNLADVWRILNPNTRRYTWHSRGKSPRLDYFFISERLLNNTNKCSILTGLHSDHCIVNLELNKNKLKRGRGFW